jgi:hypothetical protein
VNKRTDKVVEVLARRAKNRDSFDRVVMWMVGALRAFQMRLLGEFGKGGDGVVEIRFVDGVPLAFLYGLSRMRKE